MVEAVKKYSGVDFNDWQTDADAIAAAKAHNVELPEVPTKGAILAEFFDAFVEDKLIQPTFIYDYPVEISPDVYKRQFRGEAGASFIGGNANDLRYPAASGTVQGTAPQLGYRH